MKKNQSNICISLTIVQEMNNDPKQRKNNEKVSSTKWSFENIRYGSYPQNNDLGDLTYWIETNVFHITNSRFLTSNKVERFKVSLIKWLLDNRRYRSNKVITKITILMTIFWWRWKVDHKTTIISYKFYNLI